MDKASNLNLKRVSYIISTVSEQVDGQGAVLAAVEKYSRVTRDSNFCRKWLAVREEVIQPPPKKLARN